jgi:hypothetical protein
MHEWLEIQDWTVELWSVLLIAAVVLTMMVVSGFGRFHKR